MPAPYLRTALALLAGCAFATAALAGDNALNVYNWDDFIAKDTVPNFEKETGIHVRYDVFDSDDTLQAKLLTGSSGYDIVVPSSSYLGEQAAAGIYMKLDKSQLPNLANLDPQLLKLTEAADPGHRYGVPWAWGTTGLAYNVDQVRKVLGPSVALDNWDILFKPEYLTRLKSCGVSLLDSPTDMFSIALHYLGKDPNSHNPADYQAAYELLKSIRPYVTQFALYSWINDLAGGDICFGVSWSGDVKMAASRVHEAHKDFQLAYFIPKGGAPVSFQMMAIPKDAPHPEAALKWINYIERPEVHAAITNAVFYPNADSAASKYVKPELLDDPMVYPKPEVLATLFMQQPLPAAIKRLETRLWSQLKDGR